MKKERSFFRRGRLVWNGKKYAGEQKSPADCSYIVDLLSYAGCRGGLSVISGRRGGQGAGETVHTVFGRAEISGDGGGEPDADG